MAATSPNQKTKKEGEANPMTGHLASLIPTEDGELFVLSIQDLTGTIHAQYIWTDTTVFRLIEGAKAALEQAYERRRELRKAAVDSTE